MAETLTNEKKEKRSVAGGIKDVFCTHLGSLGPGDFYSKLYHHFHSLHDLVPHTGEKRTGLFYLGIALLDAKLALYHWLPHVGERKGALQKRGDLRYRL